MEEVSGGCKVCGKRMLTDRKPLVRRTCAPCKLAQRQANSRKIDAKRKAERHSAKLDMRPPRCQQCGEFIQGAVRLDGRGHWARRFCGHRCRQAAFRARD
jgi:hypothetical protein